MPQCRANWVSSPPPGLVKDRKQTYKRTGTESPLIDVVDPTYNSVPIETDLRETLKGIEAVEFPASAKGSIADTPNQRNFYRTKIQNLIKTNIQKCIQWCVQHNLAYNY